MPAGASRCAALLDVVEKQADAIDERHPPAPRERVHRDLRAVGRAYIGDLVGTTPLFDDSRVRDGDTRGELFPDLAGPGPAPAGRPARRAPTSPRPSTTAGARARCRCSRSWRATSPAGRRTRSSSSSCSAGPSGSATISARSADARPTSAASSAMDRLDGPFDEIAHTVDVRPISQLEGWYNIKNIGFFLWRLSGYPLRRARRPARSVRRATSAIISARSATRRRCSAASGAKATKRASRPSCTSRSRSGRRASTSTFATISTM